MVKFQFSTEVKRREKNWKVNLQGCSKILKETGRLENMVRISNLGKVTRSSPIRK